MKILKSAFFVLCCVILLLAAARFVFALPSLEGRPASQAMALDGGARLGALALAAAAEHPGKSGVAPLLGGQDALGSRLALVIAAQRSIDAQYYIWHDDVSGRLLLKALLDAARRGVRVRLLLDDNGVPGMDETLSALAGEPNFEIRLFNPSRLRKPKMLGYAIDFFRMNRRMHNKAMIVDGAVAIIGGRNIGDEYFHVGAEEFYIDLDVLALGAIVPETAAAFDRYWNSASVYALEQIVEGRGAIADFLSRAQEAANSSAAAKLVGDLKSSAARLSEQKVALEWTNVSLAIDDPAKGRGEAREDQLMIARLGALIGGVRKSVDLVSAYFVPGKLGAEWFADKARAGVRVRALTNALNTTDVLVVHAGYAKYRRALLAAGVELFELKLRAQAPRGESENRMPFGLSGASLHAKTMAMDDARVFIGSFNFDPRSALLNCEMGFLIESPDMAKRAAAAFDVDLVRASYRPQLTPENKMVWQETTEDGKTVIYQEEPGASLFQQAALALIGLLPVEWLL